MRNTLNYRIITKWTATICVCVVLYTQCINLHFSTLRTTWLTQRLWLFLRSDLNEKNNSEIIFLLLCDFSLKTWTKKKINIEKEVDKTKWKVFKFQTKIKTAQNFYDKNQFNRMDFQYLAYSHLWYKNEIKLTTQRKIYQRYF